MTRHLHSPVSRTSIALRLAAGAAVLALGLTACGGGESSSPETTGAGEQTSAAQEPGAESVAITISDFAYQVPDTIEPGTEVTVRNEDGVGHTVTSDEEGVFDVVVGPGEEATFTVPSEPGEYPFHCTPHPNMTDTLVVG